MSSRLPQCTHFSDGIVVILNNVLTVIIIFVNITIIIKGAVKRLFIFTFISFVLFHAELGQKAT